VKAAGSGREAEGTIEPRPTHDTNTEKNTTARHTQKEANNGAPHRPDRHNRSFISPVRYVRSGGAIITAAAPTPNDFAPASNAAMDAFSSAWPVRRTSSAATAEKWWKASKSDPAEPKCVSAWGLFFAAFRTPDAGQPQTRIVIGLSPAADPAS
jgi:hypothetical protein